MAQFRTLFMDEGRNSTFEFQCFQTKTVIRGKIILPSFCGNKAFIYQCAFNLYVFL
jgi:hypothetical protein